tara:strand:+ start:412 stop:693 length:282 start_codon:yes stop_codon:yes gene_type:complete
MKNRFNITEEEKNIIRGLHKNHSIIKEQFVFDPEKGAMLERLLVESERLTKFIKKEMEEQVINKGAKEDLSSIQENINTEITSLLNHKLDYEK